MGDVTDICSTAILGLRIDEGRPKYFENSQAKISASRSFSPESLAQELLTVTGTVDLSRVLQSITFSLSCRGICQIWSTAGKRGYMYHDSDHFFLRYTSIFTHGHCLGLLRDQGQACWNRCCWGGIACRRWRAWSCCHHMPCWFTFIKATAWKWKRWHDPLSTRTLGT